jgi:hypothetical protein
MLHQRTAWILIGIPRPGAAKVKHARTKEATRTTLKCVGIIDCVSIRASLPPLGLEPGQRIPQSLEALVLLAPARDQTAVAVFNVGQRPESVVLQKPVLVVEGFERSSELGGYNRGKHNSILSGIGPPDAETDRNRRHRHRATLRRP